MNPEETKKAAAVMLAHAEGKTIRFRNKLDKEWCVATNPGWDWSGYEYEIAPEPEYRPYTDEEVLSFIKKTDSINILDDNLEQRIYKFILFKKGQLFLHNPLADDTITPETMLSRGFTHMDSSPFGVKVDKSIKEFQIGKVYVEGTRLKYKGKILRVVKSECSEKCFFHANVSCKDKSCKDIIYEEDR